MVLQWDDVDLPRAALHVRHALPEVAGHFWLDQPKTTRAKRAVDLPAVAVAALREDR